MNRHLFLVCILSLVTLSSGYAQQGGRTVEERVKDVMAKLTPALKLNAVQSAATDSVYTSYYAGFEKMREQMQSGVRPDRSVMDKMTGERDEKLKKIFTAEQYKKFKEEVEASLRPQRNGMRTNRGR